MKLNEVYRAHSIITINDGNNSMFWHDTWSLGGSHLPIKERFPRLFSFSLYDKISVRDFIEDFDIATYFRLSLSHEAMDELVSLNSALSELQRRPNEPDFWSWTPGKGPYSAKSYYTLAHANLPDDNPCKWIWKSRCIMKIKVFAWLMLNDKLNTRDMLLRRHWRSEEDDNLCPMCVA